MMEIYLFTGWFLWPAVASLTGKPAAMVRHLTDSFEHCLAVARYYEATIAADGVAHWAYSCVRLLAI